MPEIKTEELTEEELLALLEQNLESADTYTESLIGEQREDQGPQPARQS